MDCAEKETLPAEINEREWTQLKTLAAVLKPFKVATERLEGDGVTMPLVLGVITELRAHVEALTRDDSSAVQACAKLFWPALEARTKEMLTTVNIALMAAAVHPAYGQLADVPKELRASVRAHLLDMADKLCEARSDGDGPWSSSSPRIDLKKKLQVV